MIARRPRSGRTRSPLRYVEPVQRVAVVTGASSGIGQATARLLAEQGWHCVLVARRADRLQALADGIGGEAEVCDIGDREAVGMLAARILDRHPAVHLLVNNAGIAARRAFPEVDLDRIEEVARINYLGGVWVTRALLPGLRLAANERRSHVVNVVSIAGAVAFAPSGSYTAAKHAQLAFSRSLRAPCTGAGSTCTRSPWIRPDGGLPAAGPSGPPRHAAHRRTTRACRRRDRRRGEARTQ